MISIINILFIFKRSVYFIIRFMNNKFCFNIVITESGRIILGAINFQSSVYELKEKNKCRYNDKKSNKWDQKSIYTQVILLKADINAAKLLQWRRLYTATIYMVFSLYSLLSIMSVNEPFF